MSIEDVRAQIDQIDRAIVTMIAARQQWVVAAGRLKADARAVRAPERVTAVIDRVRLLAADVEASPDVVEATYRAMIDAFIAMEMSVFKQARSADGVERRGEASSLSHYSPPRHEDVSAPPEN